MKFFKLLFDLDLYRTSFKIPIIKIVCSALVILAVSILRLSFTITNPTLNITISLASIILLVAAVLCLFIGAVEALQVGQNKKNKKNK